jgi:hypothetical protein
LEGPSFDDLGLKCFQFKGAIIIKWKENTRAAMNILRKEVHTSILINKMVRAREIEFLVNCFRDKIVEISWRKKRVCTTVAQPCCLFYAHQTHPANLCLSFSPQGLNFENFDNQCTLKEHRAYPVIFFMAGSIYRRFQTIITHTM